MSKMTLYSFGSIEIDSSPERVMLSQHDDEAGAQEIVVARDQLPSLIRLLQAAEAEGQSNG